MKNKTEFYPDTKTAVKSFRSKIAKDKEKYILSLLSDSGLVPKLLSSDGFGITMEYCEGAPVSEIFGGENEENICIAIEKLAQWFDDFNKEVSKKTGGYIALEDINPRNFLYNRKTGAVIGIDFEAWHNGSEFDNILYMPAMVKTSHFKDEKTAKACFDFAVKTAAKHSGKSVEEVCGFAYTAEKNIVARRKIMGKVRQCDCVIMAGGKSSRMGSPKGLLTLGKYTFTDRIIYASQIFDNVYISANTDDYNEFNCRVFADFYKDKGPVGAVHSALLNCKKDRVFFVPCDTPFISEKFIMDFFAKADLNADCNITKCGERAYPTIALYNKSCLDTLGKMINENNLKMMLLADNLNANFVTTDSEHELTNVNTVEEYNSVIF